jgi:putative endonuclease
MVSGAKHLSSPDKQTLRCAQGDRVDGVKRNRRKSSLMEHQYFVYIMTNNSRTLYTGVTNDLNRRVYEHRHKLVEGFTKRYNITRLVCFEATSDVRAAISREKQIKGWLRSKKIALIESMNPEWRDLSEDWF